MDQSRSPFGSACPHGPAGFSVRVNGEDARVDAVPGSWAALHRTWSPGDRIEIRIPLTLRMEPVDLYHPNRVAVVRGPAVFVLEGAYHDPAFALPMRDEELERWLVPEEGSLPRGDLVDGACRRPSTRRASASRLPTGARFGSASAPSTKSGRTIPTSCTSIATRCPGAYGDRAARKGERHELRVLALALRRSDDDDLSSRRRSVGHRASESASSAELRSKEELAVRLVEDIEVGARARDEEKSSRGHQGTGLPVLWRGLSGLRNLDALEERMAPKRRHVSERHLPGVLAAVQIDRRQRGVRGLMDGNPIDLERRRSGDDVVGVGASGLGQARA